MSRDKNKRSNLHVHRPHEYPSLFDNHRKELIRKKKKQLCLTTEVLSFRETRRQGGFPCAWGYHVVIFLPVETMFLRVKIIVYETESTENPVPDSKP